MLNFKNIKKRISQSSCVQSGLRVMAIWVFIVCSVGVPSEPLRNCGPHVLNDFRNLCNPTSPASLCFNIPSGTDSGNLGGAFWGLCNGKHDIDWLVPDDLCEYANNMKPGTFTPVDLKNDGHWVGLHCDDAGKKWIRCTQSGKVLPLDPEILAQHGFDISNVEVCKQPLPIDTQTTPFLDDPKYPSWPHRHPLAPDQRRPPLPVGQDCSSPRGTPGRPPRIGRGVGCGLGALFIYLNAQRFAAACENNDLSAMAEVACDQFNPVPFTSPWEWGRAYEECTANAETPAEEVCGTLATPYCVIGRTMSGFGYITAVGAECAFGWIHPDGTDSDVWSPWRPMRRDYRR